MLPPAPTCPDLFESRLKLILENGLELAGRKYEFLAYSARCGNYRRTDDIAVL